MKSEELDEALKGIGEPEGRRGLCWSSVSGMMANAYVDFESTMQVVIWDRGWDGFKDWLEEGKRSDPGRLVFKTPAALYLMNNIH